MKFIETIFNLLFKSSKYVKLIRNKDQEIKRLNAEIRALKYFNDQPLPHLLLTALERSTLKVTDEELTAVTELYARNNSGIIIIEKFILYNINLLTEQFVKTSDEKINQKNKAYREIYTELCKAQRLDCN